MIDLINFTRKEYIILGNKSGEQPPITTLKHAILYAGWNYNDHIEIIDSEHCPIPIIPDKTSGFIRLKISLEWNKEELRPYSFLTSPWADSSDEE